MASIAPTKGNLLAEKKKAFLSFAYGVWVTAYARDNLLRRLIELDEYTVYADTDSLKLLSGYDKSVIDKYNQSVENKINFVSSILHIDVNRYAPLDIHGEKHMLGVFECETKKHQKHTCITLRNCLGAISFCCLQCCQGVPLLDDVD